MIRRGLFLTLALLGCGDTAIPRTEFDNRDSAATNDDSATADSLVTTEDTGVPATDTATPPPDTADIDGDGDGYVGRDDCNDKDPAINPGAFEVPGNGKDDDCDGKVDAVASCDESVSFDTKEASSLAAALGVCRKTTEAAAGKDKTWGLLSAKIETIDGVGTPLPRQYAAQPAWGPLMPREGKRVLTLSTGSARLPTQMDYIKPLDTLLTKNTDNEGTLPEGWPVHHPSCAVPSTKKAYDSVALKLSVRVPTNAKSLRFDFDFYTSEYLEYACSAFDDLFAVFAKTKAPLGSKAIANNIVFDAMGRPINTTSTEFLTACTPGTTTAGSLTFACSKGRAELATTGFSDSETDKQHGATSWLRTTTPVVPGETLDLTFVIFNVSDHILQSTVLLDAFTWSTDSVTEPVTARP
jgi:hypothetical protein